MNIKEITSKDNELIKKISKLKSKKYREEFNMFMAEGEIALSAGFDSQFILCYVIASRTFFDENLHLLEKYDEVIVTTDKIFLSISDAETPQGVMGIFKIPENVFSFQKEKDATYLFCDNLRDPGNIGTIIRTADAFGIDGVMLSNGCADVFSPKLIRSTMGSIFHTKIIRNTENDMLFQMQKGGYSIVSSVLSEKSVSIYDFKFPKKAVFVIGNEAHGVSDEIIEMSDCAINIPMLGWAESLNASVAASIIMYEAAKNREAQNGK